MAYMISAVVLVGLVGLVNLVLTYGVIRRLRRHTELLSARPAAPPLTASEVSAFSAITTDGAEVDATAAAKYSLIGFFSPGCQPCAELLPKFVARAEGRGAGENLLAVVMPGDEAAGYVERLAGVASAISGEDAKRVAAAFGVEGFPTLCRVATDGKISVAEIEPAPAMAAA
jgi:thiol-disulfide isomerase/thioredoxin